MSPRAIRPFLSRLLIEAEVDGAAELFGHVKDVRLVAAEPQRDLYRAAFEARGLAVTIVDPATATLDGLNRIMAARTSA